MEVRVDSRGNSGAEGVPADIFLSLRVGEVQKQARFADSRVFRFPAPGKGGDSWGRIEVFKRIGHVTVRLDSPDANEVDVPCEFPGLKTLPVSLAVSGCPAETLPQLKAGSRARARERKDAAQRYLDDHNIEEVLAEAMKELIRAKPRDPHAFLAALILKGGLPGTAAPKGDVAPLPPLAPKIRSRPSTREKSLPPKPPKALAPVSPGGVPRDLSFAPKAEPAPHDMSAYLLAHCTSLPEGSLQSLYAKFPTQAKKVQSGETAAARPAHAPLRDFGAYYRENMLSPRLSAMEGLYSQFVAAPRVVFEEAKGAVAVTAPLTEFSSYYKQHVNMPLMDAFAPLYAKFQPTPARPVPSAAKLVEVPSPNTERAKAYASTPSVCTWLAGPPPRLWGPPPTASAAQAPQGRASQAPLSEFRAYYRENMLAPRFSDMSSLYSKFPPAKKLEFQAAPGRRSQAPLSEFRAYYRENMLAPRFSDMSSLYSKFPPAKKLEFKVVAVPSSTKAAPEKGWVNSTPSVATWLAGLPARLWAPPPPPAPAPTPPPQAFHMKPSVGTWLRPLLPAEAKAVAQPAPPTPKAFQMKPSVGTWLRPLLPAEAKAAARPVALLLTSTMLKRKPSELEAMSKEDVMVAAQDQLTAKEREIEDLKAEIARLRMK